MTGTAVEADSGDDAAPPSAHMPAAPAIANTNATVRDSSVDKKPVKKKLKKDLGLEKPMTLTKWLSIKVDELVAITDAAYVVSASCTVLKSDDGYICLDVRAWMQCSGRTYAPIFMNLPDRDLYPDYYQLIQRPVSFQLVRVRQPSEKMEGLL